LAGVTLDAGVLISGERNETRFWAVWRQIMDLPIVVPAPVLAQVWRGQRSQSLSRILRACEVEPLDRELARRVGEACARAGTKDIADAAVVVGAAQRGDDIITTDLADIRRLTVAVPFRGRVLDFSKFQL
jgi:predicted nucleic acid-binding protein